MRQRKDAEALLRVLRAEHSAAHRGDEPDRAAKLRELLQEKCRLDTEKTFTQRATAPALTLAYRDYCARKGWAPMSALALGWAFKRTYPQLQARRQ